MGESLAAFIRGDDSDMAAAGGLLVAEALTNLDVCAKFAVNYAKMLSKRR